jgi:hypothetical protein
MLVLMISKTTTLLIIGLMAVLSIAVIATVVNTASALPPGVPENPGKTTASCASTQFGENAAECPKPPRGRP